MLVLIKAKDIQFLQDPEFVERQLLDVEAEKSMDEFLEFLSSMSQSTSDWNPFQTGEVTWNPLPS